MTSDPLIPADRVAAHIIVLRGIRVLVDADLAAFYGVATKRLNEQVGRNPDRFPSPEFVFQLTAAEKAEVVANCDHLKRLRFSPTRPTAFTEYGALMAAAVLNTPAAVQVSLQVVRAFVRTRELVATNEDFARRIAALERKSGAQDASLRAMSSAFRGMLEAAPASSRRPRIGFGGGLSEPKPDTGKPPRGREPRVARPGSCRSGD